MRLECNSLNFTYPDSKTAVINNLSFAFYDEKILAEGARRLGKVISTQLFNTNHYFSR